MDIVGSMARGLVREGFRAATAPKAPQKPPGWSPPTAGRHPGTVMVRDGTTVQPNAPRRRAEPIDGALLWYLTRKFLAHYVAFPSAAALDLVTAWVIAACARDRDDTGIGQLIWRAFARLLITSAVRRSGKSTLLDLIVILTRSRRGKVPKITAARIAQVTGQYYETLAIDEAKTIFGAGARNLELQGCLIAGYTRRTSYEVSGKSLELFGAVALAAKENIITESWNGDTVGDLLDRCLTITLSAPSQPMPEVGEQAEDDGDLLARALIAWTDAMRDDLKQAARDIAAEDEEAVTGGNLRRAQISRPLRAVARAVGTGCEADVCAALDEITAGKASAETSEILAGLQDRPWAKDGTEDEDREPAPAYRAGLAVTQHGAEVFRQPLPGTWATPEQAREAVQEAAGTALAWMEVPGEDGTWAATVGTEDGRHFDYAVSAVTEGTQR